MKNLVILNNIGTPRSTDPSDVGQYLSEFLNDPYVIQAPWLIRKILVNLLIVPRRKYESAEKYKKIWTAHGSPLLNIMINVREKLQKHLGEDYQVEIGMRYGSPSIRDSLKNFQKKFGTPRKIHFLPLYPQYAESSFQSAVHQLQKESIQLFGNSTSLSVLKPFFDDKNWIDLFSKIVRAQPGFRTDFDPKTERILFSFHGLPEFHIRKTQGCLQKQDCCEVPGDRLPTCYRAQAYVTAHAMAQELGIRREQYEVAFQSRLGPTQWIRPHSDAVLEQWRDAGVRKVWVACPSFSIDCLETLEEVGIQFKELFEQNDPSRELIRIDCPNDREDWIEMLEKLTKTI